MILTFLRLFTAYRELERELDRERLHAARAYASLEDWKQRCAAADLKAERLSEQLVQEAHKVTDVFAAHAIGRRVYTKADPPPFAPMPPSTPIATGRTFARAAQAAQTKQTEDELKKMWEEVS